MFGFIRLRGLLAIGAVALATLLGGCVYAPYPGYGYYGGGYYGGGYYGGPYYGGGVVAFGGGWHEGWHGRGWR
jgi:hypothetical protein